MPEKSFSETQTVKPYHLSLRTKGYSLNIQLVSFFECMIKRRRVPPEEGIPPVLLPGLLCRIASKIGIGSWNGERVLLIHFLSHSSNKYFLRAYTSLYCTSLYCASQMLGFFFTNWRQDPPPEERLWVALLWWSGTEFTISPRYAHTTCLSGTMLGAVYTYGLCAHKPFSPLG